MKMMNRVITINLVILVLYTVICKVVTLGQNEGLFYLIVMMLLVGGQTLINIIASIIYFLSGNRDMGKMLLLYAGIVLVVGFSACLTVANING